MKSVKVLLTSLLFVLSFSVFAGQLDDAKNQGLVGEKETGYLGLVVETAESKNLVSEINAKRKAKYQQLASNNNISLAQVEMMAAKKTYSRTATGNYLWLNGKWVKK